MKRRATIRRSASEPSDDESSDEEPSDRETKEVTRKSRPNAPRTAWSDYEPAGTMSLGRRKPNAAEPYAEPIAEEPTAERSASSV